jgi:glucose-1-phosphate cytidylyltransferase
LTKVVLLAGGFGTRISEETDLKPKPMIEVGNMPILMHIMHIYAAYGLKDFIVACGYRAEYIKRYFTDLSVVANDVTIDFATGKVETISKDYIDWRVSAIDTGLHTMTGGRIARLRPYLSDGTFLVTYGDGVANVNIAELLAFHRSHGRLATVTAVRPPARFGSLVISDAHQVTSFEEKASASEPVINGGYFVFEPKVLDYISGDDMPLEHDPLRRLAADGELFAFEHRGFWKPMDTLRDKRELERLWEEGKAPWKVW